MKFQVQTPFNKTNTLDAIGEGGRMVLDEEQSEVTLNPHACSIQILHLWVPRGTTVVVEPTCQMTQTVVVHARMEKIMRILLRMGFSSLARRPGNELYALPRPGGGRPEDDPSNRFVLEGGIITGNVEAPSRPGNDRPSWDDSF